MTKNRVLHVCSSCGTSAARWAGRCSSCGEWNSLVESATDAEREVRPLPPTRRAEPSPIGRVDVGASRPVPTGIDELDIVLGGGLVAGSATLVGGEPGIGKSTLLLQLLARHRGTALYVTAEESAEQVRIRADRLDAVRDGLWLHAETSLPHVLAAIDEISPSIVVVDSIQTVSDPEVSSASGSVAQVRACAHRLVDVAKERGIAVVLVGHVTKDGGLAGPRVLEHLVDTVVHFEGDRHHALRLVRAVKHRFGPTNELGLFEMTGAGLRAVPDPSTLFLADRRSGVAGSVVVPTVEGRRSIVVEVQALTTPANPTVPSRRSALGLDSNRMAMLTAVLSRRARVPLGDVDVFVSVVGGARLTEPGLDLAICTAVAGSVADVPVPADVAVFGEVGLGGEVRQVLDAPRRLTEAARLGFRRIVVPSGSPEPDASLTGRVELIRVDSVAAALRHLGLRDGAPSSAASTELRAV